MNDQVQQIKDRLSIIDVISGYLRLNKAGVNYKGLCPFHNEKTPSFMVSPSRQSWHCFGCGEGGDIFTFVEKIENIEFPEALKILAEKAGVQLEYSDPKIRSEKDRLYQICEKAAQFFTYQLVKGPCAETISKYLCGRGLKEKTIEEWRLGYAPDSWESLLLFLRTKGYGEAEMEKAGLIIKRGSTRTSTRIDAENFPRGSASIQRESAIDRYYDRFRNRLIFPIFDANGRTVAFSGRILSDIIPSKTEKVDTGKYINSPETVLYSKSRILYGLDRAKSEIRKADKAVLVEGQMDVILPWQDGVKNIIATSGTALTEDQLAIIKRFTGNLVMAFDMDDAGFRATKRGIDLAQSTGFNVSVLRLESGKDAADFVKDNPGKLAEAAERAEPIMSYYFNETFKKFNPEKLESKKFIALALLSEIKRIPSAIERSGWTRELGLRLNVSETDLKEEMDQLESQNGADNTQINADNFQYKSAENPHLSASKSRKEILSERLLALLLKKPEMVAETVRIASFLPAHDFEILSAFAKIPADKSAGEASFSDIRAALPGDLRPRLDFLYLASDYETEKMSLDADLGAEIMILAGEIEREHYKEALQKIGIEIQKQENLGVLLGEENKELSKLIKEFHNISQKLQNLNKNEEKQKN